MTGVHGQWRQDRVDLVGEALSEFRVVLRHAGVVHDIYAGGAEIGTDSLEYLVLLVQECAEARSDVGHLLGGGLLPRQGRDCVGLGLLHQAGDSDLEELVHVAGEDRQELDAFQQGVALVASLIEHAVLELQRAQLAVDIRESRSTVARCGRRSAGGSPYDRGHAISTRLDCPGSVAG